MKATVILSCILFLIISCVKEPFELKYGTDNSAPEVPVMSPCTYLDTITVVGFSGCKGDVTTEFRDHFDYEEIIARWTSSAAVIVLTYNHSYGFKEITENTEYDLSKLGRISLSLIDYGFSGRVYKAIYGKVYITKLPNGKLRADWCNVTLKDNNSSSVTDTFGGIELP